jgi:hypothetical protein
MPMSQKVREEMLPRLRQRYAGRGREGRSRKIAELHGQFGFSRKHAIELLNAKAGWGGDSAPRKGGPLSLWAEGRRGAELRTDAMACPLGDSLGSLLMVTQN